MGVSKSKVYNWKGKNQLAKVILDSIHFQGKYLGLSIDAFKYRLNQTKGNVQKALDYVTQKPTGRTSAKLLCPDGIKRTHPEIALYLGIPQPTWYGRYRRTNMKKAWALGSVRAKHASSTPKNAPTAYKKKVNAEKARQQAALDKLPTGTAREAEFWK